jgi:hypothetical protein
MICPLCCRTDHKLYKYKDTILIACPEAPETPDGMPISLEQIEQLLTQKTKNLLNKLREERFADKE